MEDERMNRTRLKALNDAAKAVCQYCDNRAQSHNINPVHGPSGSGNWIHTKRGGGGKPVLCIATPILNMIAFESADTFEARRAAMEMTHDQITAG